MENIDTVSDNGLQHFIIGKLWVASVDGSRAGSIKISRTLPAGITLRAGVTMFLTHNTKREGKQDPDYSVSILLPTETANKLMTAEKALIEATKTATVA